MRPELYNGKGRWKIYRPDRIKRRPWAVFDMKTTLYEEFATWDGAIGHVKFIHLYEARVAELKAHDMDSAPVPNWRQRLINRAYHAYSKIHA